MGKGATADSTQTIRFAPYIEAAHQQFIADIRAAESDADHDNPYTAYTDVEIEDAFFGAGYAMASFPSLYDMFGKFLAGLDIEILFDEAFEDTINGPVVDAAIASEADILSDDIENEALPRFETGMRDMNSVMSSTFVVGRTMLEVGRTKALSRFSSQLRTSLLPIVVDRWAKHLAWNQSVITQYSQIMQFYVQAKMSVDGHNLDIEAKRVLWPFTVLDFERVALGTINQPQSTTTHQQTRQGIGGTIGGILQGVGMAGMLL